jgi:lipopolysaccharide export system ATP-binding protein
VSVLEASELSKSYGRRLVVRDVGLRVSQGEVVGILGPNGAGKTTTFYMLCGIVDSDTGSVTLDGEDITGLPLHERARLGMSYLPQESSVFKRLSVWENMLIILEYAKLSRKECDAKAQKLLEDLGIYQLKDQKAVHLSGGERRRLEIARALILDPRFMLLDEPFAGIDPIAVDEIQRIVAGLKQESIGVLISDHNVRETLSICDRAYLVFEGRILFEGSPEDIVKDEHARRLYLGEGFRL